MGTRWLTLRDVAQELGVSYETVRQMCLGSLGEPIPHLRTSARPHAGWRIPAEGFEAWKRARLGESVGPSATLTYPGDGERATATAHAAKNTAEAVFRRGLENLRLRRGVGQRQRSAAAQKG
jgi:hypothetical protein